MTSLSRAQATYDNREPPEGVFECPYCGEEFEDEDDFTDHQENECDG